LVSRLVKAVSGAARSSTSVAVIQSLVGYVSVNDAAHSVQQGDKLFVLAGSKMVGVVDKRAPR
jgi:aspartate 1-decarboxylase